MNPLEQHLCPEGTRLRQIFREWQPNPDRKDGDPTPVEIKAYFWHKRRCVLCKTAKWMPKIKTMEAQA